MNKINQRGSTLVVALTGILVVGAVASTFIGMSLYEHRFSQRGQDSTQAFMLAESAIDQGLNWLRNQPSPPSGTAALVLSDQWVPISNGVYITTVDPDDSNVNNYLKRYIITGWGAVGTTTSVTAVRQTSLTVQNESFARYAYFSNNELSWPNRSTVWFITGDHIEGPTHTNGEFSMSGTPTFDGLVSSIADEINLAAGAAPNFNGGSELGIPSVNWPSTFPSYYVTSASTGGRVFTGTTTITLLSGGTMRVTNVNAGLNNTVVALPGNGALYVNGNVNLSGTMHGQLTVGASGNVNVTNSIRYSNDPRVNVNSTDMLGILAGGDVMVTSAAPSNIEIDASIMALNHSFYFQNWSTGPARGTLSVYGGIIQANRGIVGTFNSQTRQRLSGYQKNYRYDSRFRNQSPPYFPTTGEYVPLVWQDQNN